MDGLKKINDQFSHYAGDQALRLTADAIKRTFRESEVTARFGGDEFFVLVNEEPEPDHRFQSNSLVRLSEMNITASPSKES